jgi:ribosomal protein S18 acetylase RimI-like enzyme
MSWSIQPMPLDGSLFEGAIAVYGEAFARPPYSDHDRGREMGMVYGYHGARGQWWHDAVRTHMPSAAAHDWLDDSYELVEIAVHPRHQGKGLGTALIDALLDGRPEATCVLSTRADSDAHRLYRRLGFEVIDEMTFVAGGARFYIMGRRLRPPATTDGPVEIAGVPAP